MWEWNSEPITEQRRATKSNETIFSVRQCNKTESAELSSLREADEQLSEEQEEEKEEELKKWLSTKTAYLKFEKKNKMLRYKIYTITFFQRFYKNQEENRKAFLQLEKAKVGVKNKTKLCEWEPKKAIFDKKAEKPIEIEKLLGGSHSAEKNSETKPSDLSSNDKSCNNYGSQRKA